MGKTRGIISWFESCPFVEATQEFDVNQLGSKNKNAGLYKQPAITKEKFIDGSEIVTENYYLLFRKSAQLKKERLDNDDFLENVENWVESQEYAENYPDIGYPVFYIGSNNTFYMIERGTEQAVYQLTLTIKYERRVAND